MSAGSSQAYSCTVRMADGATKDVPAIWSIDTGGSYGSISPSGILKANANAAGKEITIKASYTEGVIECIRKKTISISESVSSQKVTVLFEPNGGSACSSRQYTIGGTYGSLPEPEKIGWSFEGWYSDPALKSRISPSSTVSSAATTLYAKWANATVLYISISGSSSVASGGDATYTCTANMSDGTTKTVTPSWVIAAGSSYASINSSGKLTANNLSSSQSVTIEADYNGNTDSKTVSIAGGLSLADAIGCPSMTFTTGGSAPWFATDSACYESGYSVRSCAISHNGSSWLQTTVNGPCKISFYWRTASEAVYDELVFSIDGVSTEDNISGTFNYWMQKQYVISPGTHTLRWTYRKNDNGTVNPDCGWVDKLEVVNMEMVTVLFEPNGGSGCSAQQYTVGGTYGTLPSPTKGGSTFAGWYSDTSLSARVYASTTVSSTVTKLYAKWVPNASSPIFTIENGVLKGVSLCGGTEAVIPAGVGTIGGMAFYGCNGLTHVSIPDSVTNIEGSAFSDCGDLFFDTETIPGVKLVDGWAIGHGGSLSGVLDLTRARGVAANAFYGCSKLTGVKIGPCVKSIGGSAFYNCSGFTGTLTIPEGVQIIEGRAFQGCSGLTSISIPNSVIRVGWAAFSGCTNVKSMMSPYAPSGIDPSQLTKVTIPDGTTTILVGAFMNCSNLTSVTIPNSIASIERSAFRCCRRLSTVLFMGDAPDVGRSAFSEISPDCVAYVRRGTSGWGSGAVGAWQGIPLCWYDVVVRFDSNGGSVDKPFMGVWSDIVLGDLPAPARNGYLSLGWFTAKTGGTHITEDMSIDRDITLYAHWAAAWTVTLNANGGALADGTKVMVQKGKAAGTLPTPVREGYTFAGWYTAKSGGTKVTVKTKVTKNVTYYAHWTAKKYAVTLLREGKGTVSGGGKKAYQSKVTVKAKASKGYVFQGWWKMDVPDATGRVPPVSQKAAYSFKVPLGGVTYKAKFITKAEDKAAIGMEFGGVGFGALENGGGQGLPALPVITNMCGIVTSWPIATTGATPVSVSVKGQPKGMAYSKAKKAVTGVSSVANRSGTMTITVKSAGGSRSWAVKWRTVALDAFACGSFNGWTYVPSGEDAVRKVTVSVTGAGKITAKVGTLSLSRTGWTVGEDGMFRATLTKTRTVGSGKKAKKYRDVLTLVLNPDKGWTEDQLSGTVTTCLTTALDEPLNEDTAVSARRNPYGDKDNAAAKSVAAELAALGTRSFVDGTGLAWKLKVSASGVATISRTTGTGKKKKTTTATAVVKVAPVDDADPAAGYTATARFLVGGIMLWFRLL